MSAIHACSFEAVRVTRRMPYEEFRANAIEAGRRFSVFEATETPWRAALFDRLCRDSSIEVVPMGFPWTGVRLKK